MDPHELTRAFGLLAASFVVGVVSGILPMVNTEAFVLALAVLVPPASLPGAVVLITAGQMAAKALLYLSGSGALRLPVLGRRRARLAELRERLGRRRTGTAAVVFASASTGFPPFYLVSVAAGAMHWPFAVFLLVGGTGRLLRFAAIAALPGLLQVLGP
jgi:membrane protein YqaA with SNARE-associated domain